MLRRIGHEVQNAKQPFPLNPGVRVRGFAVKGKSQPWRVNARNVYALVFGLFLGFALLKFGNPVILNNLVPQPASFSNALSDPWPPLWGVWVLAPLALAGAGLVIAGNGNWPGSRWLWVLPLVWFGWQFVSAGSSVDGQLTTLTLWQFGGCVACYFLGALLMGSEQRLGLLLAGLLAGLACCLVKAVNQRLFEFPQERQMLVEGQRTGWTNFSPALLSDMKHEGIIISTNGVDVANPIILAKYKKERVNGTLVYPNALAGVILLLLSAALTFAFESTRRFRASTRTAVIALTIFLGFGSLFWSGSKSGWLIAAAVGTLCLLRLEWSRRAKAAVVFVLLGISLVAFAVRFRHYFAKGATSVEARFDYWRAALQITRDRPGVGSGPGTFQRPYAQLKSPEAEMARLAHNDYLEQFSDSGIVGGVSYLAWIAFLLATLGRRVWRSDNALHIAVFVGILGWFVQGLSEFGLYVPASAWTAFALGGALLMATGNQFDKPQSGG